MKKASLLALIVLLVGLPSCRKDKEQKRTKPQTEQNADMFSSSDMDMYDNYEDEDFEDDDLRTLFDFDDEIEEFVAQNDDYDSSDDDSTDIQSIAWINAQDEDELKPLYFEFNKYALSDTQKQALNHDIEQVKQLIDEAGDGVKTTVIAEGYTCQEGTPEYNLALSENRAKTIADQLVAAGIDKDSIKVVGRGQENPVVEGKTRAERAPNRRVEVRVIYA